MAEIFFPFDAGAGANITEDQWRKMGDLWLKSGPVRGQLLDLQVFADSTGMQVKVRTGKAWIKGHYYENDAEKILAINAADPVNPRIDRVVLRATFAANTVGLAVLQGVPAGSPSPPAVTQSSAVHEISLAQVLVDAAAATIAAGKVTDERVFAGSIAALELQTLINQAAGVNLSASADSLVESATVTLPTGWGSMDVLLWGSALLIELVGTECRADAWLESPDGTVLGQKFGGSLFASAANLQDSVPLSGVLSGLVANQVVRIEGRISLGSTNDVQVRERVLYALKIRRS